MPLITFAAGQRLTAAQLQTIVTQVDSLTAPGWTDYSATWAITATTTNPTLASSTKAARYRRSATSDICDFEGELTINTTAPWNAGNGAWRFSLPFAAPAANNLLGMAYLNESGVALRVGACNKISTTTVEINPDASGAAISSSGLYGAGGWTTGDSITIKISYGVA